MQCKILRFKSLTSTQDKAKELAKQGLRNIAVISDVQTKGRGRFNRKWHSGKGGLWMSIILKPADISRMQYLTFAAAVSVAKSIEKAAKLKASIKWPNDVHYKGLKLCGILTESVFGKENYIIVGIGLNLNQKDFPIDVRGIATSLKLVKNKEFSADKIADNILHEFFGMYSMYYGKGDFNGIMRLWKRCCDTIGKEVRILTGKEEISGIAAGVDLDCNLLVKLKNNKIKKIIEGDVTVRY